MSYTNKPLDGAGLAVVNHILNDRLAKKQDTLTGKFGQVVGFSTTGKPTAKDPQTANLISVKFVGTEFNDKPYTITYSGESYQGTAHDGETVLAFVKSANANYKVSCDGTIYSIPSWSYGIVSPVEFVAVNCSVMVDVTELPSMYMITRTYITGPAGQNIVNPAHAMTPNGISFAFTANSPGKWNIVVEYGVYGSSGGYCVGNVTISATDTEQSVVISPME